MPLKHITYPITITKTYFVGFLFLFTAIPAYAEATKPPREHASPGHALDVNTSRISYARKTKKFDTLIAKEVDKLAAKLKQRSHIVPDSHTNKTIAAFKRVHEQWRTQRHSYCFAQAHVQAFPVESHRFETEYFMCTYRQNQRHLNDLWKTIEKVYIGTGNS